MTSATLRCLSCGYDIASLVRQRGRDEPGVCPECGSNLRDTLENRRIPARCFKCGLNLSPIVEDAGEDGVPVCPDCGTLTACVFEQRELIPWMARRTPKNWIRTVWRSVRSPDRFLHAVPTGGNQNFIFGLMNLFIGALLLGTPTAVAYMLSAGESIEYLLESGEIADILWIAISIALQCGLAALFVGAVMTLCLYGRKGGPHLHPLDAGLVLGSCWCLLWCAIGLPAGVAYGVMLGRWREVPPTIDDLAAIAVITLYFVAVMGTVYGIWRMRFYYPDRRPYRNINTTPKP